MSVTSSTSAIDIEDSKSPLTGVVSASTTCVPGMGQPQDQHQQLKLSSQQEEPMLEPATHQSSTTSAIISPTPFLTFRRGSAIDGLVNTSFAGSSYNNQSFGGFRRDSLTDSGSSVPVHYRRRGSETISGVDAATAVMNPLGDLGFVAGDVSPPQRTRTSSLMSTGSARQGVGLAPQPPLAPSPNSPQQPSSSSRLSIMHTSTSSSSGNSASAATNSSSASGLMTGAGLWGIIRSPPDSRMKSGLLSPPPGFDSLRSPAAFGRTTTSSSSERPGDSALHAHSGLRSLLMDHTAAMANARKQRQQQQPQFLTSAHNNESILSPVAGVGGADSSTGSNFGGGDSSSIGSSYYRRQSTESSLQMQTSGFSAGNADMASPQSTLSGTNVSLRSTTAQSGREIALVLPPDLKPPPPALLSSPPSNPRSRTAAYTGGGANHPLSSASSSPTGRRRSSVQFSGYGALTTYSFGEPLTGGPPEPQATVFGAPQIGRRRSSALGFELTDSLNGEAVARASHHQNPNFGLHLESGLGESGSPLQLGGRGGSQLPKNSSAEFCSSVATPTVGLSSLQAASNTYGLGGEGGPLSASHVVLSTLPNENINLNLLDAVQLSRGPTPPSIASSAAAAAAAALGSSGNHGGGGGDNGGLGDTMVLGQGSYSSLPSLNSTHSSVQQPVALRPNNSNTEGNSNSRGNSSGAQPSTTASLSPHVTVHSSPQQVGLSPHVEESPSGSSDPHGGGGLSGESFVKEDLVAVLPLASQLSPLGSAASRSSYPEVTPKSTLSSSGSAPAANSSSRSTTTITTGNENEQ